METPGSSGEPDVTVPKTGYLERKLLWIDVISPARHDVAGNGRRASALSSACCHFGKLGTRTRFVGEHVQAGFQSRQDRVDLLRIAAREHDDIAWLLLRDALEEIGAGMNFEVPRGWRVAAHVEASNATQMSDQIGAERRVNVDRRIDLLVHLFLHEGCVKMTGAQRDEANRLH